ncbi:MAG TPA: GNAT family N-acetyltransferase [Rickettsiales bacterium]|nr:GNAT family N-acetyltransferase [Rickettsiales bacterium]
MAEKLTVQHFENANEMMIALPLVQQMYKDMSAEKLHDNLVEMIHANDYKMIAVYLDDKLVGICGYWVFLMLYCGRYIQISNFIVDENYRNLGIGHKMMNYLENIGRNLGCKKFVLDSYTENKKSHNLYFSEGFYIRGLHFMKDLT